jgi:hypothetical protein
MRLGVVYQRFLAKLGFSYNKCKSDNKLEKRPSLGIGFVEFEVFVKTRKNLVHFNLGHRD